MSLANWPDQIGEMLGAALRRWRILRRRAVIEEFIERFSLQLSRARVEIVIYGDNIAYPEDLCGSSS